MGPFTRDACVAAGSDRIMDPDGTIEITQLLNDSFAPGAGNSVYQGVARYLPLKQTTEIMDKYLIRFDLLRRKVA